MTRPVGSGVGVDVASLQAEAFDKVCCDGYKRMERVALYAAPSGLNSMVQLVD